MHAWWILTAVGLGSKTAGLILVRKSAGQAAGMHGARARACGWPGTGQARNARRFRAAGLLTPQKYGRHAESRRRGGGACMVRGVAGRGGC